MRFRDLGSLSIFGLLMTDATANEWSWTQVLGWMGWVVGIIALVIQVKSFRDQKKLEKGYVNLLEQANRDWKGKYEEAQLADLAQELAQLERKIEKEIPKQARQVFVKDQLETISEAIGELYERHSKLSAELGDQADLVTLPSNLQQAIETTILPAYLSRQRRQRLIQLLLVAILVLVIVLNYYPILSLLSTGLKIGTLRFRLGFLIWVSVLMSSIIWMLSRLLRRRIGPWFRRRSVLSLLVVVGSSSFGLLLFLFLMLISQNWYYFSYDDWEKWIGRTVSSEH